MKTAKNTILQITRNGMGSGDESLGMILLKNYLTLLNEETDLPKVITFYNEGVKLICNGSPLIEILKTLEERGVKLVACKTCLNHYKLSDKMATGIAGTMIDIMHFQKVADKVINL
uniref:DsrE family protein n=1 Tax=uncultured Draconibacterium sp. TaxID=1573823 RepID=UPI003217ABA3